MSATATTVTSSCPVKYGMHVRSFTTLRLDAIATAMGQCQIMVPVTTVNPFVCVPSAIVEERTINHIYS